MLEVHPPALSWVTSLLSVLRSSHLMMTALFFVSLFRQPRRIVVEPLALGLCGELVCVSLWYV